MSDIKGMNSPQRWRYCRDGLHRPPVTLVYHITSKMSKRVVVDIVKGAHSLVGAYRTLAVALGTFHSYGPVKKQLPVFDASRSHLEPVER